MSWVFYTFTATILWASIEVADKIIVNKEVKDIFITTSFSLCSHFIVLVLLALFFGSENIYSFNWYSVIICILYFGSILSYYSGLESEEVSRFGPTLSITTIFIVIFAYLFLYQRPR